MAAFTMTALAAEFANDPQKVGYATALAAANDAELAALINATTGSGAGTVFLTNVTLQQLMNCIQSTTDWTTLTSSGALFNGILLLCLIGPLDLTQAGVQTLLLSMMSGLSSETQTALEETVQRTGSRAEVLFGTGFVVTSEMCSQAR